MCHLLRCQLGRASADPEAMLSAPDQLSQGLKHMKAEPMETGPARADSENQRGTLTGLRAERSLGLGRNSGPIAIQPRPNFCSRGNSNG